MWRARCTAAATPSTRTCRGPRPPSGAPRCPGPSWGCSWCSTSSRASTWGTASRRVPGPGSVDRYLRYYVSNVSLGWHFTMRQFSLLWMSLVTMFSPKLPPTLLCTRWVVGRNMILIYALSTSPEQVKFARQEYPYDTECYPSWSSTNYTEKFLNTILWPYTFMVWWMVAL